MSHIPVLMDEVITALNIKADGIYVDGTYGRGGHSRAILNQLTFGHLIALDLDDEALAANTIQQDNFHLIKGNFADMAEILQSCKIEKVDGILLDLGISSPQVDQGWRGFSYTKDGPLDMRMNQKQSLTAFDIVNQYSLQQLADIIYRYGDEKYSYQIAKAIIAQRPLNSTLELMELINEVYPLKERYKKGNPAKKTFQALRIEVNQEEANLVKFLETLPKLLNAGGRCAIITFHSLEDRLVKDCFNQLSQLPKGNRRTPLLKEQEIAFKHLTKKVISANQVELAKNKRSHSAKLRILEKKGN